MIAWRRLLPVAVLAAAALLASSGCGSGNSSSEASKVVTIVFSSYGGALQDAQTKAWLDPFMKAHPNIKIIQDQPTDTSKYKAMVEAGNVTWDVVDAGKDFGIGGTTSFCTKLDTAAIPFDQLQQNRFPTTGYRVPCIAYSAVVAYRPDMLNGNVPTSFADFFDLKTFPGKRGCYNYASGTLLEMALLADGVPVDKLYPLDVPRALKKLDTIKSSIVWWTTGAQSAQLLADGQVSMGMSWNGRISAIQEAGSPTEIEIMWSQHILTADYLTIPKGSKHVKEATELVAWITSAAHSGEISKYIDYGPPNVEAAKALSPTVAKNLPTGHMDGAVGFGEAWWGENYDAVNKQWQSWVIQ